MRKKRKDPIKIVLAASVGMLFCLTAFFAFQYMNTLQTIQHDPDAMAIAALEEEKKYLQDQLTDTKEMLEQLELKMADTEEKLQQSLENGGADAIEQQVRINTLRSDYAALEKEMAACQDKITALEKMADTDWEARSKMLSDLYVLLTTGAPLLVPETEETETMISEPETDMETEETDLFVLTKEDWEAAYPHISLYYEDLTTGYHITYNEKDVRYSASLIKAPYVYAILREIEDFEKQKILYAEDGSPLYDEEGVPLFEGQHPNLDEEGNILYKEGEEKYNLSLPWVYDPDTMMKEGSGNIQYEEAGFQLTWGELIEYTLLFSDNVAFGQLRERFGMDSFYAMVGELSITGTASGFMQLSASDCASFLRALYAWFEEESEIALWMQDCMQRSAHSVMIPAAVSPLICVHKYGWDEKSYHDMGIVYAEHPYLMVIMTDLDQGGGEVDTYIRGVIRQCQKIHEHLYTEKAE